MDQKALLKIFVDSYRDPAIYKLRIDTLGLLATTLMQLSETLEVSGWVTKNENHAGMSLLLKLSGELTSGLQKMFLEKNLYCSLALLRQLIELEYLLFLGYKTVDTIGTWFNSDPIKLRSRFTPKKMRDESDGLFRDEEYWLHCDLGGHPNPRAKVLFKTYKEVDSICFALPDAIHHTRRLWNSVRLTLPKMETMHLGIQPFVESANSALSNWEASENPTVLSYDGLLN